MNKLWTFGCSFTQGFHLEHFGNQTNMMVTYQNWRPNKQVPKIWSEIIAENLNLELKNYGWPGSSVYKIFDTICDQSPNIEKDDIVIIEWTRIHRFRVYSDGHFPTILPIFNVKEEKGSHPISINGILEMQVNRTERPWIEEVYSFMKIIRELCKSIGCEVYFWSADDYIINSENKDFKNEFKCLFPEADRDMTQYLRDVHGADTIFDETNGAVDDRQHYGENGHRIMGEIFTNEIKRYRNE